MKKYSTLILKKSLQVILIVLFISCKGTKSYATAWTTGTAGDITNLLNWTDGTSSPTGFTTAGDTWAITLSMTMPSSATWTVGSMILTTASVTFAAGGSLSISGGGAAPVINIYGDLIGNGGTYTVSGGGAMPVINVHGNTNIALGSFTTNGGAAHFTFNAHGNFIMTGGNISVFGGLCNNRINFYGNCSLSGTSTFVSSGGGATGSVHFARPSSSGVMLIDNNSIGAWMAMDVYIDTGCTAQLDANFTTSTGTVANGLTVNGTLICPAADSVNGINNFNLNAGGTLIVAHTTGVNGPIVTTGAKNFSDSASYGFNGSVAQVTGSYLPATLYAPDTIKIINPAGVTLTQSTSTTGVLAFTSGILYTGTYTITLPGAATSVIGAGATKFVNGTLVKSIAGDTAVNYETGDSTYVPMLLKFDLAGTTGSIAVMANYGLHPSAGSSTLLATRMVNHYWTITNNSPAGPHKVTPKATYNLVDILGGSNTYFLTQQYDGSLWLTSPLPTTNTSSPYTSRTDTGILLGALPGDFIFGARPPGTLSAGVVVNTSPIALQLFPNPNTGTFTMNVSAGTNEKVKVVITNIVGEKVKELNTITNQPLDIILDQSPGIYFLSAYTAHDNCTAKIVVK